MSYHTRYNPSDETLLMVCNLMFNPTAVVEYSELVDEDGKPRGFALKSNHDQERDYARKEAYDSLTKEAKEVITLVLNTPKEVLSEIVSPKFGLLTKRTLKKYLMKHGWRERKVDKVFSELSIFVNSL